MKRYIIILALLFSAGVVCAEGMASHADGSKTVPVHRVLARDENGDVIVPNFALAMPFSAKETCGACHDYKKISCGRHFNDVSSSAEKGRNGEPWVLVDEKTGTSIPVSERGWKGTWKPSSLDMSSWGFVKSFGFHMPGGGMGEKASPEDPAARWGISGKLEINCLGCHSGSKMQDMTEWAKQIGRENYRWASTAAAGLGDVGGMASRMLDDWDLLKGADPDDHIYRVPPSIDYDLDLFKKGKTCFFDIARKPNDMRCLHCHSVAEAGHQKLVAGDVHSASGMNCVSCHRNGVDHKIARGIEGEGSGFSCRACHMGSEDHGKTAKMGGTYGAPMPKHKGLPGVHLDKLSCTACHSGPWPEDKQMVVRTSRANRLGIYGRAQWDRDMPSIVEPVFIKTEDGKITPCRMMWPAFWASVDGDKVVPLKTYMVWAEGRDMLDVENIAVSVLASIAPLLDEVGDYVGTPILFAGEKAYAQNRSGRLELVDLKGAGPNQHSGFGFITTNGVVAAMGELPSNADDEALADANKRINKVLELIALSLPDDAGAPAFVTDGMLYHIAEEDFEKVPDEEVAQILKAEKDAFAALDAFTTKNSLAVEAHGARVYIKGTTKKLKGKDPLKKEAKRLAIALKEAKAAAGPQTLFRFKNGTFRSSSDKKLVIEKAPAGLDKGRDLGTFAKGVFTPFLTVEALSFIDELAGKDGVLLEGQVAAVLEKLSGKVSGSPAYISGGMLFKLGSDGTLDAVEHEAAEPYYWALGHDVRPATQSLGVKGCTDCHTDDSPFFFADVVAQGPLKTDKVSVKSMHEYMDVSKGFHRLFGLSFIARPLLKLFLLGMAGIASLVVLAYTLLGLKKITDTIELKFIEKMAMLFACAGSIALTVTGFCIPMATKDAMGGYMLLTHVGFGGLYALCLAVLAVMRAKANTLVKKDDDRYNFVQKLCFWTLVVFGIILIVSVLGSMVPLFSSHCQHTLILAHKVAAIVSLGAVAAYALFRKR